jgi:large subunit ribosomal protein L29
MKSSELRAMSLQELEERLDEMLKKHYEHRVQATIKELQNMSSLRTERRDIARIKQAIAEKQGAAKAEAVK